MGRSGASDSMEEAAPVAEINVTPFVDVVLVLLVIFMITAPAFLKDRIGIQLPKTVTADAKGPDTVGLAINRQGQFLWNGTVLSEAEVEREAAAAVKSNPEVQALLSADVDSRHADLVRAIDALKRAGLQRFAIQVEKNQARP
jgi:biopolymer transport protein ExbD